ncbi:hypothetical protein I5Q34_26615 [Streptomyces sp. AV19]|uniref:hypothetical protein n=1 Tax=Streptomyces sp. AV19 TaxID=2793068 RepID=UPI0018FEE57F|nr:hypothetical protein [Streptomyces sp. AV19]MBH1937803.1 hypothetical protein [Streptomyces sp. AV19]MDG4537079.1 hypothetical protein [Streptomyces sp. AV19]
MAFALFSRAARTEPVAPERPCQPVAVSDTGTAARALAAAVSEHAAYAAAAFAKATLDPYDQSRLARPENWSGHRDGSAHLQLAETAFLRYEPSDDQVGTSLSARQWHYNRAHAHVMEPLGTEETTRDPWYEHIALYDTSVRPVTPTKPKSLAHLLELLTSATST